MNIEKLNRTKRPVVRIDKSLAKYKDKVLFKEKLAQANEVLKKVGIPNNISEGNSPQSKRVKKKTNNSPKTPAGRDFEVLVRLIQESLKDSPNTNILQNHKLRTKSGRLTEFDVIIETLSNSYPVIIAIECKDYNRKITNEKVAAFNTKCQMVPGINKKIIVSKKGFQSGAFDIAREYDILLFQLDNLSDEIVKNWIKQFGLKEVQIDVSVSKIILNFKEPFTGEVGLDTEILNDDFPNMKDIQLHRLATDVSRMRLPDVQKIIMPKYNELSSQLANEGKRINEMSIDGTTDTSNMSTYIVARGKKWYLKALGTRYVFKFNEKTIMPTSAKSYVELTNESKPKRVEVMTFNQVLNNNMLVVTRDSDEVNEIRMLITNSEGGPLNPNDVPSIAVTKGLSVTF